MTSYDKNILIRLKGYVCGINNRLSSTIVPSHENRMDLKVKVKKETQVILLNSEWHRIKSQILPNIPECKKSNMDILAKAIAVL